MRISDWSSDVCSSDLRHRRQYRQPCYPPGPAHYSFFRWVKFRDIVYSGRLRSHRWPCPRTWGGSKGTLHFHARLLRSRSEEHTSELQSLMRISYAVFCLKKKTHNNNHTTTKSKRKNTRPQHTS